VTPPSAPPMETFYGAWKCNKSDSCNAVFYSFASDSTGNVALQRLSLRLHLTGRNSLAGTGEVPRAICRPKTALTNQVVSDLRASA
jgi:hypothetical protein